MRRTWKGYLTASIFSTLTASSIFFNICQLLSLPRHYLTNELSFPFTIALSCSFCLHTHWKFSCLLGSLSKQWYWTGSMIQLIFAVFSAVFPPQAVLQFCFAHLRGKPEWVCSFPPLSISSCPSLALVSFGIHSGSWPFRAKLLSICLTSWEKQLRRIQIKRQPVLTF